MRLFLKFSTLDADVNTTLASWAIFIGKTAAGLYIIVSAEKQEEYELTNTNRIRTAGNRIGTDSFKIKRS